MMLTTALPLLPPPSTSLLPSLNPLYPHDGSSNSANSGIQAGLLPNGANATGAASSRRQKAMYQTHAFRNSTLATLNADERQIVQRKMAIAMYGYSWLKPAGCAKTMLGRREEEVEREEVEAQLREVELQERLAQEAEEMERSERTREQGEIEARGGLVTGDNGVEGERDLDEDIPDADAEAEAGEGDEDEEQGYEEGDDGDEMGMGVDLDGDVPDADEEEADNFEDENEDEDEDEMEGEEEAGWQANANWSYDTRREPDTDDEDAEENMEEGETGITDDVERSQLHSDPARSHSFPNTRTTHGLTGRSVTANTAGPPDSDYDVDERDAAAIAEAMLDEDEMGELSYIGPDGDEGGRDLDDDVPEADEAWEHTDTELEESEMDISLLPSQTHINASQHSQNRSSGVPPATRHVMFQAGQVTRSPIHISPVQRYAPRIGNRDNSPIHIPSSAAQSQQHPGRAVSGNIASSRSTSTTTTMGRQYPRSLSSAISNAHISTPLNPSLPQHGIPTNPNFDSGMLSSSILSTTHDPDSSAIEIDSINNRAIPVQNTSNNQRSWLNAQSARRTLFASHGPGTIDPNPNTATNRPAPRTTTAISGRLFTPSPAQIRTAIESASFSNNQVAAEYDDNNDHESGLAMGESELLHRNNSQRSTNHAPMINPRQINEGVTPVNQAITSQNQTRRSGRLGGRNGPADTGDRGTVGAMRRGRPARG